VLSPADADVVRRDVALPGLGTLLDPERFAHALRRARPRLACRGAVLVQLRYQPRSKCLAAFRVETDGGALDVYAKTRAGPGAQQSIGPEPGEDEETAHGPFALGHDAIVVSVFPEDAKLSRLSRLASTRARRKLLSRVLPDRPDLWASELERLRYKPEQRCVFRLRGPGAAGSLKLYAAHGFRGAWARLDRLASRGPLRLPATLGAHESYRAIALEWLDGQPLRDLLSETQAPLTRLQAVGAALRELHAQGGAALERRTPASERARLEAAGAGLAFLRPALAPRIDRLLAALGALSEARSEPAALHGDFYSKQVLLCDGRVGVLDLDQAGLGRPEVDLGLFLAHLERDVVLGRLAPGRAAACGEALLQGYQQAAGSPLPRGPLAAHTAGALLRLASYPFRRRSPDWPALVEELLGRAESAAGGAG
jgi:aminoglycoside phosphotransferase (APT) family kinase protein